MGVKIMSAEMLYSSMFQRVVLKRAREKQKRKSLTGMCNRQGKETRNSHCQPKC